MSERFPASRPGECIQCGRWCQGFCPWCLSLLCEACWTGGYHAGCETDFLAPVLGSDEED